MKRDDVIATLHADDRELHDLGIRRVAVFGSVARGDNREDSDVDLVVALEEPPRHYLFNEVSKQLGLDAGASAETIDDSAPQLLASPRRVSRDGPAGSGSDSGLLLQCYVR
jgi:predicted nucleotidyltransferase